MLVLNSYHKGFLWSDEITRGIEETLLPNNTELHVEYVDSLYNQLELIKIVSNLILNSFVHGFEGFEFGRIIIRVIKQENGILIIYEDDGIGISPENLNSVYEPFFTTKRGLGYTGLGQHIVYNNVTQHLHGSITCESEENRGSKFTISLPYNLCKLKGDNKNYFFWYTYYKNIEVCMNDKTTLKEILISLIKSIDLVSYLLKHHHRRVAVIAYAIGLN